MQAGFFSGTRSWWPGTRPQPTPGSSGRSLVPPRAGPHLCCHSAPLVLWESSTAGPPPPCENRTGRSQIFFKHLRARECVDLCKENRSDRPIAALHFCCPKFMKFINSRDRLGPASRMGWRKVRGKAGEKKTEGWAE